MLQGLNRSNKRNSKKIPAKFAEIKSFNGFAQGVEKKHNNLVFNTSAKTVQNKRKSNNRILDSLSDLNMALLNSHLDLLYLPSGEEIYAAGEINRYVYFPETAVVSEIMDLEDGNTIETAIIGNEGGTGLSAIIGTNPSKHRAQVIIKGTAWRIKTEILTREFVCPGRLQKSLFEYVNFYINQISQRIVCKAFHLLENRLCSWLLMLHDRVKDNRLKITQENTALLLGAQRPSVTIAAQTLRKNGLIDYSRGGIFILDRAGLENFACECYSALKITDLNLEM